MLAWVKMMSRLIKKYEIDLFGSYPVKFIFNKECQNTSCRTIKIEQRNGVSMKQYFRGQNLQLYSVARENCNAGNHNTTFGGAPSCLLIKVRGVGFEPTNALSCLSFDMWVTKNTVENLDIKGTGRWF